MQMTLCFLNGDVNGYRALFDELGVFAKFSGLKPNISKTQAFWAGYNASEKQPICTDLPVKWASKLKVLGIVYANQDSETWSENFEEKFCKARKIIKGWKNRFLSLTGKIVIIKTLLIPLFTHIFTALPNPPGDCISKLKKEIFQFIWGGKTDKIKRNSLCRTIAAGGQGMVDLEVYISALKVSWVKKEIMNSHDWCFLFNETIAEDSCLWERNSQSMRKSASSIKNTFWKEVFIALANFDDCFFPDVEEIASCGLWFSNCTRFKDSIINSWHRKGLRHINDLLGGNGQLMTFEEIKETYQIQGMHLDYCGLIRSLPTEWNRWPQKARINGPIMHPNIRSITRKRYGNKHIYNILLNGKHKDEGNSWESAWELEFGEMEWSTWYNLSKRTTPAIAYQAIQYKIITRIISTNRRLYQMRLIDSSECKRCNCRTETLMHKFWSCPVVKTFWEGVANCLRTTGILTEPRGFTKIQVMFGVEYSSLMNHVLLIGKMMIAKNAFLSVDALMLRLLMDKHTEKEIAGN